MSDQALQEVFRTKAKAGDGAYAIAFSILELAAAQYETARAIQRLGNGNASTDFGAIEGLSMQVEKIAKAIETLDLSRE